MQISRRMLLLALAVLALLAWRAQSCLEAPPPAPIDPTVARATKCFIATSDPPCDRRATLVFDDARRSGNGETWHAILRAELDACAQTLGPVNDLPPDGVMSLSERYQVRYRARRTWIGFDAEAGGVLVCAGEPSLLEHMRNTYQQACEDPALLRTLIAAVPPDAWDD